VKNRFSLLTLLLATVVVTFVVGYRLGRLKAIPLPLYENTAACKTLRPGITIIDAIHILGSPIGAAADYVLFSPSPTADAIKAKIDFDSGIVTELICDPRQGITWTYVPMRKK
jgi:hypothetical protein